MNYARKTRALVLVFFCAAVGEAHAEGATYREIPVEDGGSVTGRVTYVGTPPVPERLIVSTDTEACGTEAMSRALLVGKGGGIQNSLLNLKGIGQGKPWTEMQYTIVQEGCRFEPHVLMFRRDSDMHIVNNDRIAHGVRSYGKDSLFNVGQPKFVVQLLVEDFTKKVSEQKIIRVGCDLHPWMQGFVVVQDHPYYSLSDDSGHFVIEDVPPGDYELELWHETLGERTRRITVRPNQETSVSFELGG